MWYGVGIDLGTSFTSAAIGEPAGTRMVPLSDDVVVPSTAYPGPDGELSTGTNALDSADDPSRVARHFKRRLGDPTPLLLGGSAYSPAALMAAQLRDVLASVQAYMRAEPGRVVLTCPAIWGPYRREQFTDVLRQAGVADYQLITEPEAAATHYARESRIGNGDVVAVYDLGGGTFDTTILRMREGGLEILGTPEGIEHMGGVDFDDALLALLDERLGGAISGLDPGEHAAVLSEIRTSCVSAKEALSTELEVTLSVPLPDAEAPSSESPGAEPPGGGRTVTITRAEFEEVIRPAVQLTIDALGRTIASAGLDTDDLSAVLLAGGSSRIPLVSELVGQEFGKPVRVTQHPKFTVALGAAAIAARPEPVAPMPPAPAPAEQAETPAVPPTEAPEPRADENTDVDEDSPAAIPVPVLLGAATGPATGPAIGAATGPGAEQADEAAAQPDHEPGRKWLFPAVAVTLAGISAAGALAILLSIGGEDTRGLAAQTSGSTAPTSATATPSPTPSGSASARVSPTQKKAATDKQATPDRVRSTVTVPPPAPPAPPAPPSPTETNTETDKPDRNETKRKAPTPPTLSLYEGGPVPPYHGFIASEANWGGAEIAVGQTIQQGITAITDGNRLRVSWSGELPAHVYLQTPANRRDLETYARPGMALVFDVVVHQRPSGGTSIQAHCEHPCGAMLPADGLFGQLPLGEQSTVAVPVSCFAAAGLDVGRVNTPFVVYSTTAFDASFSNVRWEKRPATTSESCQPLPVR